MSYNSKAIKTDVNAKPIPQYYNPVTDEYEVLQGTDGAARQVLYGPDGQPIATTEGKLAVRAAELEAKIEAVRVLLNTLAGEDFATQTTLAQILAKMIANPATAAKQDMIAGHVDGVETLLTALTGKDFATQTTLAQILAKMIAAPATEAKQDSLATLVGAIEDKLDKGQLAVRAAELETAISNLQTALLGSQSTAAKQDALAGLVGALDSAAVSDPAVSGTVISLLKGLLSQLQAGSPVSVTESNLPTGAATAAQQEASRAILDSLNGKDYSTAAKQDAIAGLVGALDAAAVSDPAAAGAVIALLKGVLSRLQAVEGKIDGITDGTTPATTQLKGSLVAYDSEHGAFKTVNASLLHESFDFKNTKEVTVSPGSYLVDTFRPTNGYAMIRIIAKRIGAAHNWRLNANWASVSNPAYQVVEKLHTASSTETGTQTAKIVTPVGSQWVSLQLFNDDTVSSHDYHVHVMLTAV